MTRAKLIKCATKYAEDNFDKQMLDHIELIKNRKGLHAQHRMMLLEYCETYRRALDTNKGEIE